MNVPKFDFHFLVFKQTACHLAAHMYIQKRERARARSNTDKDGHKAYEVMIQGFWDQTLASHLLQHYKLPKAFLQVKGKGKNTEKAPKVASNVCRS